MFIKNTKIYLIIIVIVLLIISAIVGGLKHRESIFANRKIKSKIDIGGYGLFVNCYGKGKPTVIFESGYGGGDEDWASVQPEISQITRTFSYCRAGLGYSDPSPLRSTSLNQVHELHSLLKNAKVKPPYIIVAHSIGSYNASIFAGLYTNEVAGIVFVDPSLENQLDDIKNLTPTKYKEFLSTFPYPEQSLKDMMLSADEVKEIRKKDSLRNIPVIVLGADELINPSYPEYKVINKRIKDLKALAALSNKGKFIFVKNSGHYIQSAHPEVVMNAIKDIIQSTFK